MHNYPSVISNMKLKLWTGSVKIHAVFSDTTKENDFIRSLSPYKCFYLLYSGSEYV